MAELRRFRQLHSKTPGHPEYGATPGVETTTGPLGQGFANAVGMALAERLLAAEFNRPFHRIVDHRTYVFVGDGCLMEGVSHEAASLAGTLGLNKLVAVYDDNGISIDGEVAGWFTDDTPARFEAYGWNVIRDVDGHDVEAVDGALVAARASAERPTLICCKTVIGRGSPNKAGTEAVHGAALGAAEVAATREALGWRYEPFEIPAHVYAGWDARQAGAVRERAWDERFAAYAEAYPAEAAEFRRRTAGGLRAGFPAAAAALIERQNAKPTNVATRKASQTVLETLIAEVPELVGGSADLTGSNLTHVQGMAPIARAGGGRYIHYGVREFGMAAIMNGLALHGGHIPYGGTFLVFSDYARNALRMAALMKLRSIYVLTHDSIGLGEDGPTHQPIEHAASLRLIPNLDVWRPCDATETAVAWTAAIERSGGPTALLLSRQNLEAKHHSPAALSDIARGGYVHSDSETPPRAVVIATGSEVPLARAAQVALAAEGIAIRVVSMPAPAVFDRQSDVYRTAVLPPHLPCAAVEAGVPDGWYKYTGRGGIVIGLERFGESAPADAVYRELGITSDRVVAAVRRMLPGPGTRSRGARSPATAVR
jgi:transketolase